MATDPHHSEPTSKREHATPSGGPYRTAASPPSPGQRIPPILIAAGASMVISVLMLVFAPRQTEERLTVADVSPLLVDGIMEFPPPDPELPQATPLAPLLVADAPASLAVLAPREGATRVVRGESLTVRFNRPMVRASEVGRQLAEAPVILDPEVAGTWRWTTRSSLLFVPSPRAFDDSPEASIGFREGLASLDGEELYDDTPREVVFDGTPRFVSHESSVSEGSPFRMFFDAEVSTRDLDDEMFLWEAAGRRPVPVRIAAAGFAPRASENDPERFIVELTPTRDLYAGAQVMVALAPRYDRYGGSYPRQFQYTLAPRPRITGIGCEISSWGSARCTFTSAPGQIVDIGPALRLLASHRLAEISARDVTVSPALEQMRVALEGGGSEAGRVISITGEWAPDQVYEVRLRPIETAEGQSLVPLAPLAVRSAGSPPQIQAPTGFMAYESDAPIALRMRGIHVDRGRVMVRAVPEGREAEALRSPSTFASGEGATVIPLPQLLPDARPNRWGRGTLDVRATAPGAQMLAVAATASGASRDRAPVTGAFIQATDLGITAEVFGDELLVWLSAISTGRAVSGAEITLFDHEGGQLASGRTDASGAISFRDVMRGDEPWALRSRTTTILARSGSDRAILAFNPGSGIGPGSLGVSSGGASASSGPQLRGTVIPDRGAYRPGEPMHVAAFARVIDGASASLPPDGPAHIRLYDDSSDVPVMEAEVTLASGRAATDWTLPERLPLGDYEVSLEQGEITIGSAGLTVAEFRQPTFRVDIAPPAAVLHQGETISVVASARYLFGAPVEGATMSWNIQRSGRAGFPERWNEFAFGPAGGGSRNATLAEGEVVLDRTGSATLSTPVELAQLVRTRFRVEADVTDGTGQSISASRTVTAYPAAFEVGVRTPRAWVELGQPVTLDAIALDHDDQPVGGRAIEARFVREGWHSWYEWQDETEETDGTFQLRRDQRREVVHSCDLTSAAEPVRCELTPERGGTYVLEVEAQDDERRTTIAQTRIYVAGPDEHPDRDPPGAPIALTPSRSRYTVGQEAEIAFECPWGSAEALITVHQSGVMSFERRQVGSGGQVIRVPLTEAMVPNVFVTVALIRGRAGEPGTEVDLNAPDLRFGSTTIRVRPPATELSVSIEAATEARPGTRQPVVVRVSDASGAPVAGAQVALWAVDEGTLRLTSYTTPEATEGLYVETGASFSLEDLRRALVSRIVPSIEGEASGDGGYEEGVDPADREARERFDPTPLWAPLLTAGADGLARAEITLPPRPTEYRVMAVAMDAGLRSGNASMRMVADQPLVVRAALPRFATEGDRFEAVAFLHNASEQPLEAQLVVHVGDAPRPARPVTIPAQGELRVSEPIEIGALADGISTVLPIRFEASASASGETISHEAGGRVPIVPAARWVRRRAVVWATGERRLPLTFGSSPRGVLSATVASHPFVGLEGALEALDECWWSGTDIQAGRVMAYASYLRLSDGLRRGGRSEDLLRARVNAALDGMMRARASNGGFGAWTGDHSPRPHETVLATFAMIQARAAGLPVQQREIDGSIERLHDLIEYRSFGESYGRSGHEDWALALRILAGAGHRGPALESLYEQREFASPAALAHLALALPEGDRRRDNAVLLAIHRLLPELVIPGLEVSPEHEPRAAYVEHDIVALAAVIEASAAIPQARPYLPRLIHELILQGGAQMDGLGSPTDVGFAMVALTAAAERFDYGGSAVPEVSVAGTEVRPRISGEEGAIFDLPWSQVAGGQRQLRVVMSERQQPFFMALDARWSVPIGEPEQVARGRRVAIHRVYETAAGTPIPEGGHVPLGTMIRVRLYIHHEGGAPSRMAVRDPLPAGFDSVDAGLDTSPQASLMALLGASPDDDATDPRGYHATRTLGSITRRELDLHATTYYLSSLPHGLAELTYAIRATTPGTFVVAPAQIEGFRDQDFVARTTATTLTVDP